MTVDFETLTTPIEHEGDLEKMSRKYSQWQPRKAVLTGTTLYLAGNRMNTIDLRYTRVYKSFNYGSEQHVFDIFTGEKILHLRAQSLSDMQTWIRKCQSKIEDEGVFALSAIFIVPNERELNEWRAAFEICKKNNY